MEQYIIAGSADEYKAAAALFSAYAQWLGIDLNFQHFDEELVSLKKMYAKPHGGIILCKEENEFIGCVAIRKITEDIAELKRMYVIPGYQQRGIGKKLLERSLSMAKEANYSFVRLDTLSHMLPAINLYKKNGFYEIPPYYHNPYATAVFFEKKL
jgi:ribosomal protein S18 acetylase RimI-like enzyme